MWAELRCYAEHYRAAASASAQRRLLAETYIALLKAATNEDLANAEWSKDACFESLREEIAKSSNSCRAMMHEAVADLLKHGSQFRQEIAVELAELECELALSVSDEKLRTTALLRLQGFSNEEIASELACSVARTKQRLQRIREIWADNAMGNDG